MTHIERKIKTKLLATLARGKSVLLLGPRQTGKTTLIQELAPTRVINFADPRLRLRYEQDPGLLIQEIESMAATKPLIAIDEVQKVPAVMDAVQYLIDNKRALFVITVSSARKLRRDGDVNLLPGRVIAMHMDALTLEEISTKMPPLEALLINGSLPEVLLTDNTEDKEALLDSYVLTYLEEEVRAEALVRNLGSFSRFLELAAAEAGYSVNMNKLSQIIGVAASTIEAYYQILQDCLIVERIEPITQSKTRHRLSKTHKYLFYDLGVRRIAAREGQRPPQKYWGHLFEQFIGLELIKLSRLHGERPQVRFWQDQNGPEVDWVIVQPQSWIPIEVKWASAPNLHDARHLQTFIKEYEKATCGYIVCQTPHKMKLSDNIFAISWRELLELF